MATRVSDVLKEKGSRVVTVTPMQTVASVAQVLTENRIGAAPVVDQQGRLAGIISERDIVRGLSRYGNAALELAATELMTADVRTCSPEDAIVELMEIMTNQRIRHLPVMESRSLQGIVSIGDVVKQRLGEAQMELEQLRRYIASEPG
jgi:CBS domain-containing protein